VPPPIYSDPLSSALHARFAWCRGIKRASTYLIKVDNWLPEVVLLLVKVSHSDLSKVTRMVLVHVRSVMMLTTSKTTTTGMLAMLSYTTVSGRDMTAAVVVNFVSSSSSILYINAS
jgi:hypothetical protein